MTVFDVDELCSYWSRHPPVHILVAAFLGVGSEESPREVQRFQPNQVSQSNQVLPPSFVLASVPGMTAVAQPNMPTPIFDVAELMALRPDR
jgi:hypothetical protein